MQFNLPSFVPNTPSGAALPSIGGAVVPTDAAPAGDFVSILAGASTGQQAVVAPQTAGLEGTPPAVADILGAVGTGVSRETASTLGAQTISSPTDALVVGAKTAPEQASIFASGKTPLRPFRTGDAATGASSGVRTLAKPIGTRSASLSDDVNVVMAAAVVAVAVPPASETPIGVNAGEEGGDLEFTTTGGSAAGGGGLAGADIRQLGLAYGGTTAGGLNPRSDFKNLADEPVKSPFATELAAVEPQALRGSEPVLGGVADKTDSAERVGDPRMASLQPTIDAAAPASIPVLPGQSQTAKASGLALSSKSGEPLSGPKLSFTVASSDGATAQPHVENEARRESAVTSAAGGTVKTSPEVESPQQASTPAANQTTPGFALRDESSSRPSASPVFPSLEKDGAALSTTGGVAVDSVASQHSVEKFAVRSTGSTGAVAGLKTSSLKTGLTSSSQSLTAQGPRIGIGIAKEDATMPAGSTLDRQSDPVTAAAPVSAEVRNDGSLPQSVALPSTAHRAVEAVLNAAERFAARDQHSVNLQFSVGGSDLNVRVELRGGEVHTTFRTDSAELRAALATEWRSVTQSSNDERSIRLATPVFSATTTSGNGFAGDDARRQGSPEKQQGSNWSSLNRGFADTSSTKGSDQPAMPTRTAAQYSRHLHTLA